MARLLLVSVETVSEFKATRLAALKDSPLAFGSTWTKEAQMSEEDWLRRAEQWSNARSVGFLLVEEADPCGIAGGFIDAEDPNRVHLVSMWVAPARRRTGTGFYLLKAVSDWAAGRGARVLRLTVTSSNEAAIAFYRRCGFSMTGRTEPYPNDPALFEYEMIRALASSGGSQNDPLIPSSP